MYNLNDTIVVVSSPGLGASTIVRITGPRIIEVCNEIFNPRITLKTNGIVGGSVAIDAELKVDAKLYLFFAPNSYTGDTLAELHLNISSAVTESLISSLLGRGLRTAGPGEFTARAYLNGKIDLAQAEAVNEIVVSSNKFQLAAAEKLLSGRLAEIISEARSAMMDSLSLIEAGLDFSSEDIELQTSSQAIERLLDIKVKLEQLLSQQYRYELVIDLPSVGIAGAPNAGKSSLLNRLLGQERSIVSRHRKTTRDVLTGLLTLAHCKCVLFDCAGLVTSANNILEELAQQAAIEALRNSSVVVFCLDISKRNWAEDASIRRLIEPKILIPVATKSDLLSKKTLATHLAGLNELFGAEFLTISAKTGAGLEQLREAIDRKITELATGIAEHRQIYDMPDTKHEVALTTRHKQAVTEATENINEAIDELKADNDEVAAMMLRTAYQAISDIEQQPIDEQVLDNIFSRFCIGK